MDISLYLKAVLMGLVEGLTEFLPVSSTGHLILFGDAIRFTGPQAGVFEIVIQMGAVLAVIVAYRARFTAMAFSFHADAKARRMIFMLLAAFMPAAVIGVLAHDYIKEHLFNPTVVAISLIAGGVVMLLAERMIHKTTVQNVDDMSLAQAVKIGLFQCVAMIPGVSRSGATIIGGMFSGLDRKAAAEFSFFLAVPTLLAAGLYDLYKNWGVLSLDDLNLILIGFVSSFIFGFMVIVIFIRLIVLVGFTPFALYRILLGAIILMST